MTRTLYQMIVHFHPPAFRDRFGDEMMSIFDDAAVLYAGTLIIDGFISLVRQWVLRTDYWKIPVAILAGLLQTLFFTVQIARGVRFHPAADRPLAFSNPQSILLFALISTGSLAVVVACITIWNARFQRSRFGERTRLRQGRRRPC